MSVLFPIEPGEGAEIIVSFDGRGDMTLTGEVRSFLPRVTLDGRGDLRMNTTFPAIVFNGAGDLFTNGSVIGRGSLLPSVVFDGAGDVAFTGFRRRAPYSVVFDGVGDVAVALTRAGAGEIEITLPETVIDFTPTTATIRQFKARLTADGVEIPIVSFRENAPPNAIGRSVDCRLARPVPEPVSVSSIIRFEIAERVTGVWVWETIIDNGTLAGREHSLGFNRTAPSDALSISIIDAVADKFLRAPAAQPVTLYDPARVQFDAAAETYIRTESGAAIRWAREAVAGLTLDTALQRAYVAGCGFTSYQTNIPNHPIAQVDFTLENGFHAGVAPLVAAFEPLYFEVGTTLWILSTRARLPGGFTARTLPLSAIVALSDTIPAREPTARLIVEYRDPTDEGMYFTERLEQDPPRESGSYGAPDFTRTEVTRRIREWRRPSAPQAIVREAVAQTTTSTYQGQFADLALRERQTDRFDAMGRKLGHVRTVESRVPNLAVSGAPLDLLLTEQENSQITYAPHPKRPRETILERITTLTSGLIHVDNDNEYRGEPFRLPYVDAHRNARIDPDADQTMQFGAIRTRVEEMSVRGDGETDVRLRIVDHIAGTEERSSSTPRTGESVMQNGGGSSDTVRVLLTRAGATAGLNRRIPVFDAGELPRSVAIELGRIDLAIRNRPPRACSVTLPGFNTSMRRGVVFKPTLRAGVSASAYICEGYTREGEAAEGGAMLITQQLSAREIVTP